MKNILRVAAVQMNSRGDKAANQSAMERLVGEAARGGAELVVLPELWNCLGTYAEVAAQAEPIPGPTSQLCSQLAAKWNITLCAGSIAERSPLPGRAYNTSLVFDPTGKLAARYAKIHLFDVDLPGRVSVRESDHLLPGGGITTCATPAAALGMAICYDLRFAELFRALASQGMEVLLVPAAFTLATGRDHWELLVRTRAVENQCFAIAANQCGRHSEQLTSYGHSLIVDPWGAILAQASEDREEVLFAELQGERLQEVRSRLPALQHRRL